MRITYLAEDTAISGALRIQLAQADALIERGHDVRFITTGAPLTWRSSRAEWVYVDDLRAHEGITADVAMRFPIVDDVFYRATTPREHRPPRVLLSGASQVETNGIDDGYGAVAHARWFHQKLDLTRVSPWAPSREEPLDSVQEFHVALNTDEMARLLHSCDLFLAPHRSTFALAAAEAMAAGIPCLMEPKRNAVELGEKLIELLENSALRERLRANSRDAAKQWRAENVIDALELFLGQPRPA
ncbi:MAG TPA: glycosyltransferase [Thermoanaerobaculia bacterium]|nr:glycosyltransferase [Thermoanaerobaculia bacterium]